MPNPEKVRARLEKKEAKARRELEALRARAERRIGRIREDLREEEARITSKLHRRREKAAQKLGETPISVPAARPRHGTAHKRRT